jgi:hypothetical protein
MSSYYTPELGACRESHVIVEQVVVLSEKGVKKATHAAKPRFKAKNA